MDEHTYPTRQPSALDSAMDLVRKSADSNLAYLDQLQEDLKQSHLLSERIQRMKRQDLALLTKRFHTALEKNPNHNRDAWRFLHYGRIVRMGDECKTRRTRRVSLMSGFVV